MISLSHTAGYAVLALACIGSWKGDWVQSEQIHACTGVPKPYLRKLLQTLVKAGLLKGKRGYHGGVVLSRPAKEITLLDVILAVESNDRASNCLLGLAGCSDESPCPMRQFWQREWARIEAQLKRMTLADAAKHVRDSHGMLTKCADPDYVPKCGPTAESAKPAGRKKTRSTRRKKS